MEYVLALLQSFPSYVWQAVALFLPGNNLLRFVVERLFIPAEKAL